MTVYKFSNVSGFKNYQKYNDFLAGNPAVILDSGSMYPLGVFTLAEATATVTFSNIPQTYTHLQVRGILLNTSTQPQMLMRFNSDSAGNYSRHQLEGNGSTATSGAASSTTSIIHFINGIESTTTAGSSFVTDILDYRNTNKAKTIRSLAGTEKNGSGQVFLISGAWYKSPLEAINTITLTTNTSTFAANSSFALYGIQA
jgi:hypothetical protein